MNGLSKGIERVEVRLKWDPSPLGAPPSDLDLIAATYSAGAEQGDPAYLVHFDSRAPDGTMWLNRDSKNGQGFGFDEVMTLELDRLGDGYRRVVVGAMIQQSFGRLEFGAVANPAYQIVTGWTVLVEGGLTELGGTTAATFAEFTRSGSGAWSFHSLLRGYDEDPDTFGHSMGRPPS
ncbi:TerD family protein [Streptomyces sp. NBC_00669]|uniref:TerD family protein n=1 Tax=unclassified Streptomyces TaxID=2593676 RepID=UPI002E371A7A|nr:TerD family protein [Streptomyces sp. NBC_00669]